MTSSTTPGVVVVTAGLTRLILDEPANGLDPAGIAEMRGLRPSEPGDIARLAELLTGWGHRVTVEETQQGDALVRVNAGAELGAGLNYALREGIVLAEPRPVRKPLEDSFFALTAPGFPGPKWLLRPSPGLVMTMIFDVFRSDWVRLRRPAFLTGVYGAVAAIAALATVIAFATAGEQAGMPGSATLVSLAGSGGPVHGLASSVSLFGVVAFAAAGAHAAGDCARGTLRNLLARQPRRAVLLAGKTLTAAAVVFRRRDVAS
jgi:hypothetical protein